MSCVDPAYLFVNITGKILYTNYILCNKNVSSKINSTSSKCCVIKLFEYILYKHLFRKNGKLYKSKGFNDYGVPEVGMYLRWSEFETLVRLFPLLKKECQRMQQRKTAICD